MDNFFSLSKLTGKVAEWKRNETGRERRRGPSKSQKGSQGTKK